jgi:high-affinity Fe2+/Pb2+ permease
MYCPEVSFFFQFTSFIMLMVSVLLAVGWMWYYDRYFVKKQNNRIKRRRPGNRRR